MRKKWILSLALFLTILLCGCTESEINCGITPEHEAFLNYNISIDMSELELREQVELLSWIRALAESMERDHGFSVEHNAIAATGQVVYLRASLTRKGANTTEAITLLRQMLTDETLTPFTEAEAEALSQPLGDVCRLYLRLEPGSLLETIGIDQFPKRTRERVEQWLEGASVRLRISLPATELPDGEIADLAEGTATKSITIPITENGELELTSIAYSGGGDTDQVWAGGAQRHAESPAALEADIAADQAKLEQGAKILRIAAAFLAGIAVLLFLWGSLNARKRRQMRPAEEDAVISS